MHSISLDIQHAEYFAPKGVFDALEAPATEAVSNLNSGRGAGSDFHGWVKLPSSIPADLVERINTTAQRLRSECDYVVCVGIGGSYLGAKAVIEALSDPFANMGSANQTRVVFAGQNISEDYMASLTKLLKDKKFGIIVISKSGTTTEPAIAFRLLREQLENQAGKDIAKRRIVAITDKEKGALRTLADQEGYDTFVIPDNVGGRFSVLTPVGLLPIAVAGFDIQKLVDGAKAMENTTLHPGAENPAETYARLRNALYKGGRDIEILVNFDPKLHYMAEWWKQLFGESEGKDGKGIFPAAADFTTDLHSMGQLIQDGKRNFFETVLSVEETHDHVVIPTDAADMDGLNYLAGRRMSDVNKMAELGTRLAHVEGGVPNIRITMPMISEYSLGQLIYFFEKACGISGYLLGVNPFDQPGVEAYKKNMFALLGKPGYEAESKAIKEKL